MVGMHGEPVVPNRHARRTVVPERRRRLDEPAQELQHLALHCRDGIDDLAVRDLYPLEHARDPTHAPGARDG